MNEVRTDMKKEELNTTTTKVVELGFIRDMEGAVTFTDHNLALIKKYIIPIIEKNIKWGTGDLTAEEFKANPDKFKEEIKYAVHYMPSSKCYVALEKGKPVALLEYAVDSFEDIKVNLDEIYSNFNEKYASFISNHISGSELKEYYAQAKDFLKNKKIYYSPGVCLKPELQEKKSGLVEQLFEEMKDGLMVAWTSNPLFVNKARKCFENTIFFPLEKREIDESNFTMLLLAILETYYNRDGLGRIIEPGFGTDPCFVTRDPIEELKIAKSLFESEKITKEDFLTLEKILNTKNTHGIIVSC